MLAKADLGQDHQAERRERQAKAAVTFKAIASSYLAQAARAQKAKTLPERVRHLNRDWKPFHARPVHEIDRRDVAARLQVIAEAHGPIASNRARATLSAFYAWAIGHGLAETNPVVGTVKAGQERSRDRTLTAEEIAAVWQEAGAGRPWPHRPSCCCSPANAAARLLACAGARSTSSAAVWSLPRGANQERSGSRCAALDAKRQALLRTIQRRGDRELLFGSAEGPFSGWGLPKRRVDARIAQRRAELALAGPSPPARSRQPVTP